MTQCSSAAAKLSVVIGALRPHRRSSLSGETSPMQNALTDPHTHRCHGEVLPPNIPTPPQRFQARAATSRRQEPHIQGQLLP